MSFGSLAGSPTQTEAGVLGELTDFSAARDLKASVLTHVTPRSTASPPSFRVFLIYALSLLQKVAWGSFAAYLQRCILAKYSLMIWS